MYRTLSFLFLVFVLAGCKATTEPEPAPSPWRLFDKFTGGGKLNTGLVDKNDNVWITGPKDIYQIVGSHTSRFTDSTAETALEKYTSIVEDRVEDRLVFFGGDSLLIYGGGYWYKRLIHDPISQTDIQPTALVIENSLFNHAWAVLGDMIYLIDNQAWRIDYRSEIGLPQSVSATEMVCDNQDYVYLGSDGGGLYRCARGFTTRNLQKANTPSLISDTVTPVKISNGYLWVRSPDGVQAISLNFDVFQPDASQTYRLPGTHVNDVAIDQNKKLWVATDNGVYSIETGGTWKPLVTPYTEFNTKTHRIFFDHSNRLWILTENSTQVLLMKQE